MLKTTTAVMVAAADRRRRHHLSAPTAQVNASPLPTPRRPPMHACAQRAWPYLRCVGTAFGNPHIRLVSTDRLN